MSVNILKNLLLSFSVVRSCLVSLGDERRVLPILLCLLPTPMTKGNAKTEVSENKEVTFKNPCSWIPSGCVDSRLGPLPFFILDLRPLNQSCLETYVVRAAAWARTETLLNTHSQWVSTRGRWRCYGCCGGGDLCHPRAPVPSPSSTEGHPQRRWSESRSLRCNLTLER